MLVSCGYILRVSFQINQIQEYAVQLSLQKFILVVY